MKILFLVSDLSKFGGIEVYNVHLLKALKFHRAEVELVQMFGTTVRHKLSFVLRVIIKLITFRPNHVRCSHVHYSSVGLLIWLIFRIPYTISFYGVDVAARKTMLQRVSVTHARVVMFAFDWSLPIFLSQFPSLGERIFLNQNPFDDTSFQPKEKSIALLNRFCLTDKKIILTIARRALSEKGNKGYYNVIRALPMILERVPNAVYLLVGGGDDVDYIAQLIQEVGVEGKVILSGRIPQDELVDYYNLADVFAHPSQKEGFPIVCLEAMACGKTVIAGQYSEEPLLHGEIGITVDPQSVEEIADAIIHVLNGEEMIDSEIVREKTVALYGYHVFQQRIGKYLDILRSDAPCV